jgi:hypothetical protein
MTPALVDPTSGMLAGQWCPTRERLFFKPGTEPGETCNLHTEPIIEEEPPMDIPGGIPIPDSLEKGVNGIGKVLRKIFRW